METPQLKFTNWKARCSTLGELLTCLPIPLREATEEDTKRRDILIAIRDTGKNPETNRKNDFDDAKKKELQNLENIINRIEPEDVLPPGAITHLKKVFNKEFWGRHRKLKNKFLTKGTICETDALDLVSQRDDEFYVKNEEHIENDFIQGTPDNIQVKTKDTKANWDLESFQEAELSSLYEWQLIGYMWILHSYETPDLQTKTEAELDYCLVNAPEELILDELKKLQWELKVIDLDYPSEEYIQRAQEIERNMIFDVEKFQREYRTYNFYNTDLDFSIPAHMRLKSFDVQLTQEHIKHITKRVTMAREWLIEKEKDTLKQIGNGWQKNN